MLGERGILKGSRLKTLIDLSTTGPTIAGVVAKSASERGVAWVDSPVSGGVGGATKGTLAVMVSCRKETFPVVDPVLKTFGKTFYVGEKPGLAQIAKLANNLLAAAAIVLSSEALAMGVKAGLDATTLCDIINAGSGRNSATQDKFPKSVIPRTFDFGFATGLSYKDVRLCLDEAEALGCAHGGRRGGASDARDHEREVRTGLRLHVHRESRRGMGGGGDQVERSRP